MQGEIQLKFLGHSRPYNAESVRSAKVRKLLSAGPEQTTSWSFAMLNCTRCPHFDYGSIVIIGGAKLEVCVHTMAEKETCVDSHRLLGNRRFDFH